MNIWNTYESRMSARGTSKRDTVLGRELHMLAAKSPDTVSYQTVNIGDTPYDVVIVSSDNLDEKTLFTTESDVILGGEVLEWMGNHWLVVERDAYNEVYTKAKLQQCNHLLRWVDKNGIIQERWCIVNDGTKYLTGEYEDRHFIVTRGDSRIQMIITRDSDTAQFGREQRFLIDDPDNAEKLAYTLSKPLKVGAVYNGHGVYKFVLQESFSTDDDNHELGIADYYKFFPKPTKESDSDISTGTGVVTETEDDEDERGNWL